VLPEAEQALHDAVTASRAVLRVPEEGGAVAWNQDGTRFAAAGAKGTVVIHDAASGKAVQAFAAHDAPVNGIAFSPDGALLGTTGEDGYAKVWDLKTGKQRYAFKSPKGRDAIAPAFSPDGSLFAASMANESFIHILDVATGRTRNLVLNTEGPRTRAFAFDPTGARIVVALDNFSAEVVDLRSGARLDLGLEATADAAWSTDGSSIATAHADGSVRVFDAHTLRQRFVLLGHGNRVNSVDWSRDGNRIVTASDDGTAKVWAATREAGRELFTLSAQATRGGIVTAAFSPDGSRIVTGDVERRAAIVWDASIAGDAELANLPGAIRGADPGSAVFTPDGRYLLTSNAAGGVSVWDAKTFRKVRTLGTPDATSSDAAPNRDPVVAPASTGVEVSALDVSPDGLVAAAIADYNHGRALLRIWDIRTGHEAIRPRPRGGWVEDVAWSPDGSRLAISTTIDTDADGHWDHGSLAVVDRSGKEVAFLPDEDLVLIRSIAFTSDGKRLIGSRSPLAVLIRSIAFTSDGERLIGSRSPLAGWDTFFGQVAVWDWKGGRIVRSVDTGQYEAVLSPRADLLASTPSNVLTGSQVAEVWDWATGRHLRTLHHSGSVTNAAFSRDGSRLATASQDGTVRIWDPYTDGAEQLVLRGHTGPAGAVAFSPDGSRLASESADGTMRVWALDLDELVAMAERGLTRNLTDDECRQYLHTERCSPA
jgi:WD40 repeat protein